MAYNNGQRDFLKELLECNTRIIGILKKLKEIEKSKGQNSSEYKSMCGLLQDFLTEEEYNVSMLIKDPIQFGYVLQKLSEKEILKADEALYSLNFSIDNSILYRMNRLLLERNCQNGEFDSDFAIKDNIDETIDIAVLKNCQDVDLKYKLAFTNPKLCIDMAQSNFDVEMISIEFETTILSEDQFYEFKKMNYLRKRFAEIISFIAENELSNIDIYYKFLLTIKKNIPEPVIIDELRLLVSQGIPFEKINLAYNTLLRKEKAEKKIKKLD